MRHLRCERSRRSELGTVAKNIFAERPVCIERQMIVGQTEPCMAKQVALQSQIQALAN